jgi:hypothetical protein
MPGYEIFITFVKICMKTVAMTTITIRVNNRTKKGKHFLYLISKLAEDDHLIQIEKKPNAETLKAMQVANEGIGKEFNSMDELFKELGI